MLYQNKIDSWELNQSFYSADKLSNLVQDGDIVLSVSGFPVSILEMARAGWTCNIKYNKYGGRTRFMFRSKDGRSGITFRISGRWYPALGILVSGGAQYTERELFRHIADGVLTSIPAPIPSAATDEELLEALNRNIKRRLALRRKPKSSASSVLERAEKFVAA
jgi:hypothetical protein